MDYPLYTIKDLAKLYEENQVKEFTELLKQAVDLLLPFAGDEEVFLERVFMEYIPRINYDEATIVGLFDGNKIAGAAIITKNKFNAHGASMFYHHPEIVAFGIKDEYLGKDTSLSLAEYCLSWLGCNDPTCAVTEKQVNSLSYVIKEYDWEVLGELATNTGGNVKVYNSKF